MTGRDDPEWLIRSPLRRRPEHIQLFQFSEQTQRWQIGFVETSRPRRKLMASGPFRTSRSDAPFATLPIDRWKKQGRTTPSLSTTAETQGALQRGATDGCRLRCARK